MAARPDDTKVTEKRSRARLTDKRLERLTAGFGERTELADDIVRELRVRVGKTGTKRWSVLYRVAGKGDDGKKGPMRRISIGSFPEMSVGDARERARAILQAADGGIDPSVVREEEVELRQTRTFDAVVERYLELHVKRNTKDGRRAARREREARAEAERTGAPLPEIGRCPAERLLVDIVQPKWGGRLLETVSRAEVNTLLDDIVVEHSAPIAREVRKHLAGLFNWAADRGMIALSPVSGLRRKDLRYTSRKRFLSMEELGRVWDAAGEAGYPFGEMVRLIVLTGQRRSEIAGLRREWLDEEDRAVEIPADDYKTGIDHVVPLSPQAWAIVSKLPRWNEGDFMFSTTAGRRPVSGFSKAKAALDRRIAKRAAKENLGELEAWTLHDLRRSVATHMARLGVQQEHIERVLGHIVSGVAGTYNRYGYLEEKRAALETWGAHWDD